MEGKIEEIDENLIQSFRQVVQSKSLTLQKKLISFELFGIEKFMELDPSIHAEFLMWKEMKQSGTDKLVENDNPVPIILKENKQRDNTQTKLRRHNRALSTEKISSQLISSEPATTSKSTSALPRKRGGSFTKFTLPLKSSYSSETSSEGTTPKGNSSDSMESTSSRNSPKPGFTPKSSPGREFFLDSSAELYKQDEKRPSNSGFRFINALNQKRKDPSPRTMKQSLHSFKFPLDETSLKLYLSKAKAIKKEELPKVYNEEDFKKEEFHKAVKDNSNKNSTDILVLPDPYDPDKIKIFLLDKKEALGVGKVSTICKVWDLQTKQLLAGKVLPYTINSPTDKVNIETEINNLIPLNRYHGYAISKGYYVIVMNYAPTDSLEKYLYHFKPQEMGKDPVCASKKSIHPFELLKVTYKLLDALRVVHEAMIQEDNDNKIYDGLCHRDIKPANFQIDEDCNVELVDVETAFYNRKDESKNPKACIGTPGYLAPELLDDSHTPYTKASDIFQLGIVIMQLHSSSLYPNKVSEYLFADKNEDSFAKTISLDDIKKFMPDVYNKQCSLDFNINQSIEEKVYNILYKDIIFPQICALGIAMTNPDPKARLKGSSLEKESIRLRNLFLLCEYYAQNYINQIEVNQRLEQELTKEFNSKLSDNAIKADFMGFKEDLQELKLKLSDSQESSSLQNSGVLAI